MSGNGTAREDRSFDEDGSTNKRRRIAFSCLACRKRKLKCDRVFPSCSRCQKGGHPEACTYDSEAIESGLPQPSGDGAHGIRELPSGYNGLRTDPHQRSVARSFTEDDGQGTLTREQPPEDAASRLYAQEERIRQLERRIIGLEKAAYGGQTLWSNQTDGPKSARAESKSISEQKEAAVAETMIFKGKHFKTQFFGASHHISYLSHLPELRVFMSDMILQHPGLAPIQRELKSTKFKDRGRDGVILVNDNELISMLPEREVTDQIVRIYIENLETTYRVLHLPSFWSEYNALWDAPHETTPAFVALILLMLATSNCMGENTSILFRGDSSLKRETATMWVDKVDTWLQSQSQKHVSLTYFQIHCLSFIAKQMNSIKRKRLWMSVGNLLRLAMSTGLHRNAQIVNSRHAPQQGKKISVFDQEMRRRIWTTVSELELQAALERGMPTMLRDLVEDCGSPLNIDDEGFDQTSEQLPNSRPSEQFTRSSYQHLSRSSWSLRLELVSSINSSNSQMSYGDVLLYDKKIMQRLGDIPHLNDQEGLVPRILLQLQLRQLLLYLHRPYARDEPRGSRRDYSAVVHLKSAMVILDLHEQLKKVGRNYLCLFRNDTLRAALSIYYNMSFSDPKSDNRLHSRNYCLASGGDPLHYLQEACALLEDKVMCLGTVLQEYYCVSAILGLVRKRQLPDSAGNEEQVAADRVAKLIQRVLDSQDSYSVAATLASLPNMPVLAPNGPGGLTNGHESAPTAPLDNNGLLEGFGADLEGLGLTNIAGWDLDTFWNF